MTDRVTNPKIVKELCERYGFRFKKGLGQNFLIDESVVEDTIVGTGITRNTSVIEIGPGFGSLTQSLLEAAKDVTAIELDSNLIPVLTDLFGSAENFHLINADVLKTDLNQIIQNEDTVVVANLPYYITTPIVSALLEKRYPLKSITVMVQKEVAKRMVATCREKDYGALSCMVDYYTNASILRDVKPHCFTPQPSVNSSIVLMKLLKTPKVNPKEEAVYFKTVKAVFLQRRKTLLNGLSNSGFFSQTKEEITSILEELGYSPTVRGETLSIQDFCRISDQLSQR